LEKKGRSFHGEHLSTLDPQNHLPMLKFPFFLILLFLASLAPAQSFDRAKLDSLLDRIEANDRSMGSLSIFQAGELVYHRAIGYADRKLEIEANPETRYRIGSISKPFTATLILQLVEGGKLSLDTKLAEFFPDLPNAEAITIEHLLRHRSGLFNYTNAESYPGYMEQPITRAALLDTFRSQAPIFEPGSRYEYSNTNYTLLTFIAEDLTDEEFPNLLRQRILEPLGLQNTYYGGPIAPTENEARSYDRLKTWELASETDMSVPRGAGALVATADDLNRFFTALLEGELLADSTVDQMTTLKDGYGLGLTSFPFYERRAYGHGGGIDGFQSTAGYFPQSKVAVAYLSNGVVMPIDDILIGVLSIYFGRDYKLPEFAQAVELSEEKLDRLVGVYGSPTFPLEVTITQEGGTLMGQATGQPQFPLEAIGEHLFQFQQAGLELEFAPEKDEMTLRQGGGTYVLTRKQD